MKEVNIISKVVSRGKAEALPSASMPNMAGYATMADLQSLKELFDDFISGDDVDVVINRWKDVEDFLAGISEEFDLLSMLGLKADKADLANYVTIGTVQTITGLKDFTGGIKVNGSPIVYDAVNKYWKLEGDLLVTGGITMFGSDSTFKPSTIMDAIATDEVNLKVVDGVLMFVGSSGGLSEVHWDDVIGRPTLLSSFIDDVVDGHYLPLSGIGYTLEKGGNIPFAGSFNYNSIDDFVTKKSFIGNGQNTTKGHWFHLISVRADNGNDKFGMYIGSSMTDVQGSLFWNRQEGYEGNWQGERVILDSVNWSQYVTAANGGRYLPLSGGTLTGSISLNAGAAIVDNSTVNRYYMLGYDTGSGRILVGTPERALSIRCQEFAYLNDNVFFRSNQNNPYIGFIHGGYSWYLQAYNNNYIYIGAGSANSLRIDASGNILTPGGITMYSDKRKKTILNNVELTLQQIAEAPLIEHYYNSDEKRTTHVGSIAQYWAGLNDWFCKLDNEGFYTMEIQNAALASAISIARELQRYESKTDKKIRLLKKRIGELEDKIEELEKKGV